MCDHFTWGRKDEERADAHEGFKEALVHQFNSLYGTEVDDIHSWRGLALALDIFPLPENVAEAKKVFYQRVTPDPVVEADYSFATRCSRENSSILLTS